MQLEETLIYIGSDIVIGNKNIALTLSGASLVDFNGKNITVGNEGTGLFLTDTGDFSGVSNLGEISQLEAKEQEVLY